MSITKDVDKTTANIPDGDSAEFNYTVNVSHDDGTDGEWQVDGTITVSNPNSFAVSGVDVSDTIDNGGTCTVSGGTGLTVPANGSSTASYTCTFTSNPGSGTNTATATWPSIGSPSTSATGTEAYDFSNASPSLTDECVNVSDTVGGSLGTVCVGDANPTTFTYSHSFSGDTGGTCTTHDNTATFTTTDSSTSGSASQAVEVCVGLDLTVAKDATPAFTRTFTWDIAKDADNTQVNVADGGSATFDYTVTVHHDDGTDSDWQVSGNITVHNPNDWEAIDANLGDAVDNSGSCTVSPSTVNVPAGGDASASYTCTYSSAPSPPDGTNTATASWDKDASSTSTGSAQGTAGFDFGSVSPALVDEWVSVSDTLGGSLGTACVGDPNPTTFTYSHTVAAPALGTCVSVDNTATFTTDDSGTNGSASRTVTVCHYNAALSPGYWKNHLSSGSPNAAQFLPQTLGSFSVGTTSIASAVFNAMNCSNASTSSQNAIGCLAGQLLAVKLSLANNSDPSCITGAVAAADTFLAGIPYVGPTGNYSGLPSSTRATALSLKAPLDAYITGGGC